MNTNAWQALGEQYIVEFYCYKNNFEITDFSLCKNLIKQDIYDINNTINIRLILIYNIIYIL